MASNKSTQNRGEISRGEAELGLETYFLNNPKNPVINTKPLNMKSARVTLVYSFLYAQI
jgi:hypothetical protein